MKRYYMTALFTLTIAFSAIGCANGQTMKTSVAVTTKTQVQQEEERKQPDTPKGSMDIGKVTAVNGNTITVVMSEQKVPQNKEEMEKKTPPQKLEDPEDGEGKTPPQKPEDPEDAERKTPPQKLEETEDGEGKPLGAERPRGGNFSFTGEEKTIVIEKEEIIKIEKEKDTQEQGSLSDITEGAVVRIQYGEDETMESILLLEERQMPEGEIPKEQPIQEQIQAQ